MIISASRRCDIPASFPEWFSRRLDAGFVVVRNPYFPDELTKISLSPDVVDVIVFWTKNPAPILPHLDRIDAHGIPYYFQFTLTPYGHDIEPCLPKKHELVETFKILAHRIGSERVVWRYDPILLSETYDMDFHSDVFEQMCSALEGCTSRCVISFLDEGYSKVRLIANPAESGRTSAAPPFRTPTPAEARVIAASIAASATKHGMSVETCAEDIDLSALGIERGRCIDARLVEEICGSSVKSSTVRKPTGQRSACGCLCSTDVGEYNLCSHGCAYCYANYDERQIRLRMLLHDDASPVLVGNLEDEGIDVDEIPFSKSQASILDRKLWRTGEGLFD